MENLKSNPNSHLTAKERDTLSFPSKLLINKNLLIGVVLDFGCGFGNDVKILKANGINIEGYDNYHFPEYPTKKYDTIICFYVLNVLLPEEQAIVLMELSQLIKPKGKVYIAVRRDLQFEGYRMHKIHQKKTYQCNVILKSKSFFKNKNCEIYEYQHYNQINRTENLDCPFCNPDSEKELIVESATAYAVYDKLNGENGTILIIPKRHCSNYFELSFKEQSACIFMINEIKRIVSKKYNINSYNILINIDEKFNQKLHHVYLQLNINFRDILRD